MDTHKQVLWETVKAQAAFHQDLHCWLRYNLQGPPDSSVGRASAFGAGGRGFESRPYYTKGVKNGTNSSLADARIKGVVLGR